MELGLSHRPTSLKVLITDILPRDIKLAKYDVFGPLDTRVSPDRSHGVNLTVHYKNGNAESCIQVKSSFIQ